MTTTQSILIILTGSLGDLVRGLSVACAIKNQKPETHITWLVDSTWHYLIRDHPAIDVLLVVDRKNVMRGLGRLLPELRRSTFDITLDLQRHLKSGLCSWLSGAPRRIGFHPNNCKEGNQYFNTEYIAEQSNEASKLFHYFAFLEAIDCKHPDPVDFGFAHIGIGTARKYLPDTTRPVLGIVISSSWVSKDWPLSGYVQLLEKLTELGQYECILLGTVSDVPKAEVLLKHCKSQFVHTLAGKTSLIELLDVIRSCRLCVGPDSGPGHLAAAVGVPYISLFGPTPPVRVAPYGNEQLVVQAGVPCSPCSRKVCPGLNTVCMRLISPAAVMEKVHSVLLST